MAAGSAVEDTKMAIGNVSGDSALTIKDVFDRIAGPGNDVITHDRLKQFVNGALGGKDFEAAIASDEVMKELDTNKSDTIERPEFRAGAKKFREKLGLSSDVFDAAGVGAKGSIDFAHLKPLVEARMPKGPFSSMMAEVGAKVAIAAFGRGDVIFRSDMEALLAEMGGNTSAAQVALAKKGAAMVYPA